MSSSGAARRKGPPLSDAVVTSLSEKLDFHDDHFEKRVLFEKDARPAEVDVEIAVKGRPVIKEKVPLPDWLDPDRAPAGRRRSREGPRGPLALRQLRRPRRHPGLRFPDGQGIPAPDERGRDVGRHPGRRPPGVDDRPPLRHPILALQAVSRRKGLRPGSEVNIIPWSQVFFRTKGPAQGMTP